MREILFRGKRVENGEWIEGSLIITTSVKEKTYIVDSCCCYDGCVNEDGYADFDRLNAFEVIPETVGQFTGLTDKNGKNGKKIFEGDIVKGYLVDFVDIGFIRYVNGGCRFQFIDKFSIGYNIDNTTDFEVIGNIHDNPELLKGGADNAE